VRAAKGTFGVMYAVDEGQHFSYVNRGRWRLRACQSKTCTVSDCGISRQGSTTASRADLGAAGQLPRLVMGAISRRAWC